MLVIPTVYADFTQQNGEMNATYTLTATYVDSSNNVITGVSVSDNYGFTTTATTGTWSNTYNYGSVVITSTKTGYAVTTTSLVIDNDTTMNITMATAEGGQTVNYFTPHQVRFMCRDYLGKPIEGMSVSAVGVQTTLGSLDWLLSLFGINSDSTPITSTLMSGTTGYDGSIVFVMLESEKYKLTFVKSDMNINESRYYYPKEDQYYEIFWTEQPQYSGQVMDFEFDGSLINATHARLEINAINYVVYQSEVTNLTLYVDNATWGSRGETVANNTNYTQTDVGYNTTFTVDVPKIMNGGYVWGIRITHSNYTNPIEVSRTYEFGDYQWKINPLNAANGDSTATTVYNYAAVGIIALFAFMFSRANIKFGVVVVPLVGALFQYIGWLLTGWFVISVVVAIGVLLYFRYSEEESGL